MPISNRPTTKVPLNVYDGDRPVCQCRSQTDAKLIVNVVNDVGDVNLTNIERAVRERIVNAREGVIPMPASHNESRKAERRAYVEALEWVLTDVLGVSVV